MAVLLPGIAPAMADADPALRTDYALHCQGCHLDDGRGFPQRGVPALDGFVARFTSVPGGRAYLVQVPGVAQSALPDARLARLLNWMLSTFDPAHLSAEFVPYVATEVGQLRAAPLAEVGRVRSELLRSMAVAKVVTGESED